MSKEKNKKSEEDQSDPLLEDLKRKTREAREEAQMAKSETVEAKKQLNEERKRAEMARKELDQVEAKLRALKNGFDPDPKLRLSIKMKELKAARLKK